MAIINGTDNDDVLIGTGDNDTIIGGAGNDTLFGGGGDDTFRLQTGGDKDGTDWYDGGSGINTIQGGWSYDVLHVLDHLANLKNIQVLDGGNVDASYNTVLGTDADETLDFSAMSVKNFVLDGGAGNDLIIGTSSDDLIRGGRGDDKLSGAAGDDTFLLITGDDVNGTDWYDGGSGFNTIKGDWTYDVLHVVNNLANLQNIQMLDGGNLDASYNTVLGTDADETLDFSAMTVKNFVLDGGAGNDSITGTAAADLIRGGKGDDKLNGGAGDDTFLLITGGDNNGTDYYDGGSGLNTIKGDWSYDVLHVVDNLANLQNIQILDGGNLDAAYNTVLGSDADETLNFSNFTVKNFVLDGGAGNDIITGTAAADLIRGGKGDDKLSGGAGDDTFLLITGGDVNGLDYYDGGSGSNTIKGDWSYDVLHVANKLANLQNIQTLDAGDVQWDYNTIQAGKADDTLDFSNFKVNYFTIDGGAGNDNIIGNADENHIRGGDGNDTITGAEGNDVLSGGAGDDLFRLIPNDKNGTDWYDGGTGVNTIKGDWTYDVLHVVNNLANLKNIQILDGGNLDASYNTVLATDADDTLDFSALTVKNFVLDGGAGNDSITGTAGADLIRGGVGDDKLNGAAGDDTFLLITGGDTNGVDYYDGGSGINTIKGDWSYDVLHVVDNLANLKNIQVLDGGNLDAAYNTVLGTDAGETLDFSAMTVKNFVLDGGAGNDSITGTVGADLIRGGVGDDKLNGGAGDDTFLLITGGDTNGVDYYDGGSGINTIKGDWSYDVLHVVDNLANLKNIQVLDGGNVDASYNTVLGTDAGETLDFSAMSVKNFVIDGGAGNDSITGTAAGDLIRGGAGDDKLFGGAGDDTFLLITGSDSNGLDFYDGGSGSNSIKGGWSYDTLHVNNFLSNLVNIQMIDGGDAYAANNLVVATPGADLLPFYQIALRNLTVQAQEGDDTIVLAKDADYSVHYQGNRGNDTFVFESAARIAVIDDFNRVGNDVLDVRAWHLGGIADLQAKASQSGSNVLIDLASGSQIVLVGTTLGSLDWSGSSDFLV